MNWRIVDSDLSEPTFTAAADEAIARAQVEKICLALLANPVINDYSYEIHPQKEA